MARPTLYLFTAPGNSASGVTTAFGQLSPVNQPHARSYAFASYDTYGKKTLPRNSQPSSYDHLSRDRDAQLPSPSPPSSVQGHALHERASDAVVMMIVQAIMNLNI